MSQSRRDPSQYLKDRIDAHAAEHTQSQRSHIRGARQPTRGYGDVSDDGSGGHSTPKGPSSFRAADRDTGRSRRSSTVGTHGTDTPRSGGAKEQSEQISRLQNENYGLKERVYYLDKKLQEMDSQEQKLLEQGRQIGAMQAYCDELRAEKREMKEVVGEARDEIELMREAVDQAVSRIYELELENKEMRAMLEDARRQRSAPAGQENQRISSSRHRETAHTSPDRGNRRPARNAVSSDVANRLASFAQVPDDRYLPSFITHKEPSMAALRRMYVEGDQIIRPIPSQATILDKSAEDFEDPHVALKSPQFSELSDADQVDRNFGSSGSGHTSGSLERRRSQDPDSPQSSVARTNQWVEESSASPSSQRSRARPSRSRADNYPSIGQALQSAPEDDPFVAPRPRPQQQLARDDSKQSRTPPATGMPSFGPSIFPPTPDTMATRPSNTSTSSFATDRYAAMHHSHRVAHPQAPEYKPVSQRPYQPRPRDIMPMQLHRYDDRSPERDALGRDVYSSDSSSSPEMPRKDGYFPTVSLAGSTAIDAESMRDHNLTSQSSRDRTLDNGPFQPNHARQPQGGRTPQDNRQRPWQYDGGADVGTLSSRGNQSGTLSNASLTQSPRSSHSQGIDSGVPLVSAHQTPPLEPLSPSSGKSSDKEKHPRSTLRQRLNRLRRNSNASESTPGATPTNVHRRSNSISQRFGFRRSSTTSQTTPVTARFDGASAAAFAQAANAAAPALTRAGAEGQGQPQQQHTQITPQPPARSSSNRSPHDRPPARPFISAQSIPARTKGASFDAVPLVGEFGELKAPMAASTKSFPVRSRTGSKSGPPGTPLVETATIAFPTRGRESTPGSKARGVLRSLSRSRTDGVQRSLGSRRG